MHQSLLISTLLLSSTTTVFAHDESEVSRVPYGLTIQGSLATSYRSLGRVESNQRWIIPGFLMGGKALPKPKGFHLDEFMLSGEYKKGDSYAYAKLEQHGSEGLAVEHAMVGHSFGGLARVELGRLNAAFSPYNGVHSSQTHYSDTLLIYDALWGRQYNDTGLRLQVPIGETGVEIGVELWQGDAFPAKRRENIQEPYDLFLSYHGEVGSFRLRTGGFYYLGRASARQDERYSAEHSHGLDTTTLPVYSFDGKTRAFGFHGRMEWDASLFLIGFEGEYQNSASDGQLRDTTRLSPLQTDYRGFWGNLYYQQNSQQLALRYERLKFENELSGPGATALAEQAQLVGSKDPYRLSLAYNWLWDEYLKLRAEWVRDFSTSRRKDMGVLGMIWVTKVGV